MPEQKALYLAEKQGAFALGTAPIYKPGPGEILMRVESVGLSPGDWVIQDLGVLVETYPAILRFDLAGTVEELGEGATRFKKGERVYVIPHLTRNFIPDRAHFAVSRPGPSVNTVMLVFSNTRSVMKKRPQKIPDNMSLDQAATITLGICTAAIALYHDGVNVIGGTCGLTPAWEPEGCGKYQGHPVVVFGGAGSVGQAVAQAFRLRPDHHDCVSQKR
ncbi:hypothetical protein EVJ58_g4273 [Rhodofomes roseus]|uniref:Alcohol dehydrogenase-like N-terminal domain-containing protein n=1 Tax=Rhodofomes roseus TaxID=34475 RepID=A0A4Y9YJF1_9APHY|nr:hypothetical protein EVJ58_g4273 [Rhodofomes roseus]